MLAEKLIPKYRYENCAVLALNDGGVMVGAQIASKLHCVLNMLVSTEIMLPREPDPIAGMAAGGTLAYNHSYSQGEIDEMTGEYFGYLEQEKMTKMHEMNSLLGDSGTVNPKLLKGHNVIIVSDGLKTSFPIDLAMEYLKPIATEKIIMAVPFASVQAVDRMHILADDLYVLNVLTDYMDTNHYYDTQDIPDHDTVLKTIQNIVMNWK